MCSDHAKHVLPLGSWQPKGMGMFIRIKQIQLINRIKRLFGSRSEEEIELAVETAINVFNNPRSMELIVRHNEQHFDPLNQGLANVTSYIDLYGWPSAYLSLLQRDASENNDLNGDFFWSELFGAQGLIYLNQFTENMEFDSHTEPQEEVKSFYSSSTSLFNAIEAISIAETLRAKESTSRKNKDNAKRRHQHITKLKLRYCKWFFESGGRRNHGTYENAAIKFYDNEMTDQERKVITDYGTLKKALRTYIANPSEFD